MSVWPNQTQKQFKQEFIERVATARIATGKKQWQVAELLECSRRITISIGKRGG
jgi:hypothetical protein